MELESVLMEIERSRDSIILTMSDMIRIPALAPVNGGEGEGKRADFLMKCLEDYDSIVRVDVPDDTDPSVMRPNILAKKNGKKAGTVWIVAHMDTVPAGDLEDWDTPPFEPVLKKGRIYGRGTEDNGQAVLSAMYASKFISKDVLTKHSIGLAYVSDEETTSKMGIEYLLNEGYFSDDDIFIVPDWGSPEGDMIDVAEKDLIWLQFNILGKSTHGSTPDKGINALRVGADLLSDLMKTFEEKFSETDESYDPPRSTFEPTKSSATVLNVNTIPGNYEFSMDIRMLPRHALDEVVKTAYDVVMEHERRTGACINITEVQRHTSGKPSSVETETYKVLAESIKKIHGTEPRAVGVGGATCANFFRERGYDAYVWECGGGTLHGPNEYVEIDNIITDAKVFASVFFRLCV